MMHIQLSPRNAPSGGPATRSRGDKPGLAPARRIAIVEDELIVAWSLESTVEDLGYSVIGIYADANAVLASLAARPAELVLMDINLGGGMDGVETACRIKAFHAVPIIFISAYADQATRARIAKAVPGARLLRKPVQAVELEAALRSAFSRPD